MVTVFVPSTPTSFSGYVLVVPRKKVIELPMTVEEALRLLVSGGVITPGQGTTLGRQMPPALHDSAAGEAQGGGEPQATVPDVLLYNEAGGRRVGGPVKTD